MMVLRPVCWDDLSDLLDLAEEVGGTVSSLVQDADYLKGKVERSIAAFSAKDHARADGNYFFVLANNQSNGAVGTAAINVKINGGPPYYTFKLSKMRQVCHQLGIKNEYNCLNLVNDCQAMSEISSLYLKKQYRGSGLGKLLSRGRFLFMAQFRQRFSDRVFASMQGFLDEQAQSPFWEHVGKHFFLMPLSRADQLATLTDRQFIADLVPNLPIYVNLLPESAQRAIGEVHPATRKDLGILNREGFEFNHTIDIFDGGPSIECKLQTLRTVQSSQLGTVVEISQDLESTNYLVSNCELSFRAGIGPLFEREGGCHISSELANALAVKPGDDIRFVPL